MHVNFLVHIIGDHADNVNIPDRSVHTIKKNTGASVVARSGDRIPGGGGEIFRTRPDRP